MKTQVAVLKALSGRESPTKYAVAKQLGVRPIMIDHYLNGSRMKQDTADRFQELFGYEITDVYNPTQDALKRAKSNEVNT